MAHRATIIAMLAASVLLLAGPPVGAQAPYPARTVRIVLPSAAGSTTDALARIVADQLARVWGKSVIVENIAGGAMNTGATSVAHAAPDGYTLFLAPPAPLAFNDLLYKDIGYRPQDFVPITLLATIPNILVVRHDFPAHSLAELIAMAKASPGKLTYASQGVGSTAQLSAAQLEVRAGIKMVDVPYRGAQPALTDVMAGQVDMFFDTPATSVPLYHAKMLNILAVADTKRSGAIPEIPTFAEAGLPGFRSITWFAMAAPPGTPAAIVDKVNHDVVAILHGADTRAKLANLSLEVGGTSREETSKFFAQEAALWGSVIKEAGIERQ
jgi:tripartite-type tricarboxylate transporter receptor subunit TctC